MNVKYKIKYNYSEDNGKFKLIWSAGNFQALYLVGVFLLKAFQTRKQYIMNHATYLEIELSCLDFWALWSLSVIKIILLFISITPPHNPSSFKELTETFVC